MYNRRRTGGTVMNEYVIFTDSACDISQKLLGEWNVKCVSLTFMFEGSDVVYAQTDMSSKTFYDNMRGGKVAKTSAVNMETFKTVFEEELKNGRDILYLGFSSGLSTTFNSARMAGDELMEAYPDRKVVCVDSLAASAGQGLLLYMMVQKKREGASIEENAEYAEKIKLNICHWFTVDDLVYLKRGGRISPTVAFVGGLLGIKPVLHVDNEGHLVNVTKVRGRKAAIRALADKYSELALDPKQGTVFISHGDCLDEVEKLAEIFKKEHGVCVNLITDVGSVIGAHSGPGTIALFFVGKER